MHENFVRPAAGDAGTAGTRLVIFPHAGGGPASVSALAPLFGPEVDVWSVNLPGRQARAAEAPRDDLDGLVEDLASDLAKSTAGAPLALFGYCSGALLAFLVCRRLSELDAPPSRLIVGSALAPDIATPPRRLHLSPSDAFWDRLIAFGGVPEEIAGRTDLRPVLEPALRADFGLQASYRHRAGEPFGTPITVVYGSRDASVTRGGLLGWRRQTTRRPVLRPIESSHWLIEDAPAELAAVLTGEID
ncbi:MAG: thioesterase II family protein [Thermocrispum sp.]